MSHQSSRRIITNRQLNHTLCPVDLHNPKAMPYGLPNYAIDGTWNQHQSIILDVLLERTFLYHYSMFDGIPKSWRAKQASRVVPGFLGGAINQRNLEYLSQEPLESFKKSKDKDIIDNYWFSYTAEEPNQPDQSGFEKYLKKYTDYDSYVKEMSSRTEPLLDDMKFASSVPRLIRDYPVLKKYRYKMIDTIKGISETKFQMVYRVKFMEDIPAYNEETKRFSRGKLVGIEYCMPDFQNIFDVEFDGDVFAVNFKSPLGKMIIHNMLILDTDWIPEEAFELSKNAYFIFKKFILGRVAGKNKAKEIRLWFDEIKSFLDMHWTNDRGIHASIDKAFREMQALGLVSGYRSNKDHLERQYVITF